MRILVLNPNTSTEITDRLAAAARQAAAPGTDHRNRHGDARRSLYCDARRGADRRRDRARNAGGTPPRLRRRDHRRVRRSRPLRRPRTVRYPDRRHGRSLDAHRLHAGAAFRHRDLRARARSLVPGMRRHARPDRTLRRNPHARRSLRSIGDVQDEKENLLAELAGQAALELEADVVILAGAPLAGLAARIARPHPGSGDRSDGGGDQTGRGACRRSGFARRSPGHFAVRTPNRRLVSRKPWPRASSARD